MQVNFNPSVNQSKPSFKAKFSNDVQTIGILKKLAKKKPIETILAIDLLKEAGTNDIISLKSFATGSVRGIKIINDKFYQQSPAGGKVETDYHKFFDGIQKVFLSNGKYVGSATSKIKRVEDFANPKIIEKQIELKNFQNELIKLETKNLENNSKIAIEYIDNNI